MCQHKLWLEELLTALVMQLLLLLLPLLLPLSTLPLLTLQLPLPPLLLPLLLLMLCTVCCIGTKFEYTSTQRVNCSNSAVLFLCIYMLISISSTHIVVVN
jgi:hypothetical protein